MSQDYPRRPSNASSGALGFEKATEAVPDLRPEHPWLPVDCRSKALRREESEFEMR